MLKNGLENRKGNNIMKQEDVKATEKEMKILKNQKLSKIGRAAAMAWLIFGNTREKEYALHLQCSFRICKDNEIAIANLDMFEPTKAVEESPSFSWDTFNYDIQGINLYDEWAKKYNQDKETHVIVQDITVNAFGDLLIHCSQGLFIEVIVNDSMNECWRFFELTADEQHLVISGQGIMEE